MNLKEQLRILETAQSDPAKLTLASVDLAYSALSDLDRSVLKESLEGAAIPHWCDEAILAGLLGITLKESADRLARLRRLSVVEPFPARGSGAVNVHEAARLALRKAIAAEPSGRFRTLSTRAVGVFEGDTTPVGRIEWIYHLLCADPERGAATLENDDFERPRVARPEERHALAVALAELDESGLVHGRARVQALFVTAWARVSRGEAAQLGDLAISILSLARSLGDRRAEAEAQALLGDVMRARGNLAKSRAAYEEYLAISRRLVEDDPSNLALRRELAVAQDRVGGALMAQGDLPGARAAFEAALAINRQLTAQDPDNERWQSDLAVACNWLGGVLRTQDNLAEARASFEEALAIRRRLAASDPNNDDWQSALGVAHKRLGEVLQKQGKLVEAQAAFEEALAISRRLAASDPNNDDWQSGLAIAHHRMGQVLEAQGHLTEAEAAFEADLAISRRLATSNPNNADWQSDLAVTYDRLGGLLQAQGNLTGAQAAFDEALMIRRWLAAKDPSNADWQADLAMACARSAKAYARAGRHSDALQLYEEAYALLEALCRGESVPPDWVKIRDAIRSELTACRSDVGNDEEPHQSVDQAQTERSSER